MQQVDNNILFRILSYILCILAIWGYGIFIYLSLFEIEFITKAITYSFFLTLGYVWSWYNRHSKQYFVKFILALLMIYVGIYFFRNLSESIYDPRVPLLDLLISLLVIHSFDLPRKRDVLYSITSSLVVIIVLTVVSFSNLIIPYILLFCFVFFVTLFSMDDNVRYQDLNIIFRLSAGLLTMVVIISLGLFIFLPKPSGGYFLRFVFAPRSEFNNYSQFTNPQDLRKQLNMILNRNYAYRSFRGEMDLESRGTIPHILIMKVKSPVMTYVKGIHLIYYDGKKWYNKKDDVDFSLTASDYSYFSIPSEFEYYRYNIINTYFMIVQDLPDILYHIPVANEVFFPSSLLIIRSHNIYTEYPLVKGVTYTVSSKIPYFNMEMLKSFPFKEYQNFFNAIVKKQNYYLDYLYLPEISERIKELSRELTENEILFWNKVEKIKGYLEENYTYDLFIDPPKTEAVYDFLFIQRRGYCEQFASSMAVMLRSIGIPCRVVLGYVPRKRDIFTGFWEVYADDAHAWVEVLSPFGWIPVDPSPYNVDEQTLRYLESKNRTSSIYMDFQEQVIQEIEFIMNLAFRILFILLVIFVIYNSYLFIRKKYIYSYIQGLDISKIEGKDMNKAFRMFIEYFKLQGTNFPPQLTLREMKSLNLNDPAFQKFTDFIDVYEKYTYGPK